MQHSSLRDTRNYTTWRGSHIFNYYTLYAIDQRAGDLYGFPSDTIPIKFVQETSMPYQRLRMSSSYYHVSLNVLIISVSQIMKK